MEPSGARRSGRVSQFLKAWLCWQSKAARETVVLGCASGRHSRRCQCLFRKENSTLLKGVNNEALPTDAPQDTPRHLISCFPTSNAKLTRSHLMPAVVQVSELETPDRMGGCQHHRRRSREGPAVSPPYRQLAEVRGALRWYTPGHRVVFLTAD